MTKKYISGRRHEFFDDYVLLKPQQINYFQKKNHILFKIEKEYMKNSKKKSDYPPAYVGFLYQNL